MKIYMETNLNMPLFFCIYNKVDYVKTGKSQTIAIK